MDISAPSSGRDVVLIEITTFRLAAGVDAAAFLRADQRVQTVFIPNLPGFLRRTTARGEDGDWLVMVLWGSAQQADVADRLALDHPVMKEFTSFADAATYRTRRFTTLD